MKLIVDAKKYEVKVDGMRIDLSPKEFDILQTLVNAQGNVVTRKMVIKTVWGPRYTTMDSRTVDQHVCRLRRKIGAQFIMTVPTRGFRYIEN